MNSVILYDDCQRDVWHTRIAQDINPVPADQYLPYVCSDGLWVLNASGIEWGGGLVSNDYPLPPSTQFFGMNVQFLISSYDLPHLGRNEMDLKITLKSGSAKPIPNQANGSTQQNASKDWMWQLDPDGKGWVDSGYAPGPPKPDVLNSMQFRFWSDGNKWSVTGLKMNDDTPFIPGSKFQNLPMITTNWTAGLHPQLQMEVMNAPWFLRQQYKKIQILSSQTEIPWS